MAAWSASRPSTWAGGVAGVAVAILWASACADVSRSNVDLDARASAVLGGEVDLTHPAVVFLQTVPGAPLPELCTGTVIGPRAVLTAGHCAAGQTSASLVVGIGRDVAAPERTVPVRDVFVHPRFGLGPKDEELGLDVGVVFTTEDLGIAPVALLDDERVGAAALVGYGQSNADDQQTRGLRRVAMVDVVAVCATLARFGDAKHNGCHGDSGGPLLFDTTAGPRLGAVVSYGGKSCATPTFAARVVPLRAFLDDLAAGVVDPTCAKCPPTPATCGGADAGAEADAGPDAIDAGNDAGAANDAAAPNEGSAGPTELEGGCSASVGAMLPGKGGSFALAVLALVRWRRGRARFDVTCRDRSL